MNESKPWYLSKTVWGAALAILASLLHPAGVEIGVEEQGALADQLVAFCGAAGALLAVYGRISARHAIGQSRRE